LGTIEKWATRQGFLHTRPVANALTGIPRTKPARIGEFSQEQTAMLMRHVLTRPAPRKRYGALLACYVHLAACCGLRLGEINALDLGSVDLVRKRLKISRNLTAMRELKGPKSAAGNRMVPIPDHLCEMLQRWLDVFYLANDGGYFFTTYQAAPVMPTNFRYGWHYILKECGLYEPGNIFHFHALRHFSGSWWLHNGMPIQDVALQMGHADASTTLAIYAHTVSKVADRQAAMTQMGSLLIAPPTATVTHAV
jgi:integrase